MFKQILALVALPEGTAQAGPDLAVLEGVRTLALAGAEPKAHVHLLHVVEQGRGLFDLPSRLRPPPPSLDVAAHALAAEGIQVTALHAQGRLTEEVERIQREAKIELVVVGRPSRGWGDHGLRVVRLSDAPVLVMPEGSTLRSGVAVVGMDFSPNALRAYHLARSFFGEVRPVAVIDAEGEQDDVLALRTRIAAEWAALAGDDGCAIHITASTRPADALLEASADADMLAVGSRGLTPLAAVLLGSTAEKLGARCPCPLLVYRDPGTRRGLFESFLGVREG